MFAAKKLQGAGGTGGPTWDLDYAYYDDPNAGDLSLADYPYAYQIVSAQDGTPLSVTFSPDGTRMYVGGADGQDINQYTLSTAWNITTASYVTNFSISATAVAPKGIWFKPDGTKFYVTSNDWKLYQYSCSTAWSLSTASYDSVNFNLSVVVSQPASIQFNSDGTTFFVQGINNDRVYQYSCSTAWNISTASYASKSFSYATQAPLGTATGMSSDGTKLYVLNDSATNTVFQYNLSTAWDISTASYASKSFVASQENTPYGMFVRPDGSGFYIVGPAKDTVYQYTMGGLSTPLTPSLYQPWFKPDGTKMYLLSATNDDIDQYSLSTPWNTSTASYDSKNLSTASRVGVPISLYITDDGTKVFFTGTTQDTLNRYDLSTAWDISTGSYSQSFLVQTQDTIPNGFTFSPDGTKMYYVGRSSSRVYQYTLSTAWNLSTCSYTGNSLSTTSWFSNPGCIAFNRDGTKMFLEGHNGLGTLHSMFEFELSTAWNITTASYSNKSVALLSGYTEASGFYFKPDGSGFFVTAVPSSRVLHTFSIGNQ